MPTGHSRVLHRFFPAAAGGRRSGQGSIRILEVRCCLERSVSTLKKIKVMDLREGMFLHAFDGSWLQHPFWKSSFLIENPADIRAAHGSSVLECWIDTAKGRDIDPVPEEAAPLPVSEEIAGEAEPPASVDVAPEPAVAPALHSVTPASFDDELRRAATLCQSARQATLSMFNEARLGKAVDTDSCMPLVSDIANSVSRNPGALISLARLKTSDDYTYMHSVAVCALMVSLGRALGMGEEQCRQAGLAGLMHDIGKAAVPLAILNKPGKLTDEEFAEVKHHPARGHELLLRADTASEAVLDVCLHHHEKVDGSGYPDRLKGEDISLMARMGAVCDVYDAVTSNRPYKAGWDPADAIARMVSWKGHFDPKVLSAFIKAIGIYPTGALVKMRSGRLAVVVEQNAAVLTKPVVKVFFSTKSITYIPVERLDLAHASARDEIVSREARSHWKLEMIDELWAGDMARMKPG
jgi:HD-GYP domain-containing protein (c-di-GMP phosphodiesterase class II)